MTGATRRRWLVPAVTLVLLVLGTVAVTLALALALSEEDGPAPTGALSPSPPPSVPVLPDDPVSAPGASAVGVPVAELADPAWVRATSRATGVPARALTAYAGASIAVADTHPSCGLGWNTLAAIGEVESQHGSIGRARLAPSGDVDPVVLGVPLDGDGGRIDGDRTWDRAVGPMQFIPSTWDAHAADGNADGTPDVHHIDDAALTAATYLCSAGGDLTQPDSWIAAISSYNPGTDYNGRVAEAATRYADEAESGG